MLKTAPDDEFIRSSLLEIISYYRNGHDSSSVKFWQMIAEELSHTVKKKPSWSWRYPQGVAAGTIHPSLKFIKAIKLIGAVIDGVPLEIVDISPVTVYANKGSIQSGSIVMGISRICDVPGCNRFFVPNVPWRKKCPVHSPPKC